METRLKAFIKEENLFSENETILLAVSGGMDSITMCELFHRIGQPFAIAHCNFQLREEDSNMDEQFVRTLALQYNVPFYCHVFDTYAYAKEKGISIQMAARELRYQWFDELLDEHGYAYLATAHHQDDSIETFFINLFRGTGIRGLRGILPKNGRIVHPVLFASRKNIETFVNQNNISFREDRTNASVKYERNRIRHELLPLLQEYSKNLDEVMAHNLKLFRETELALNRVVVLVKEMTFHEENNVTYIDLEALLKLNPNKFYLYEMLRPYGFNGSVVEDINEACKGISGKQFYSHTHRLIKDRKRLVITPLEENIQTNDIRRKFYIKEKCGSIEHPVKMQFSILHNTPDFVFEKQKNIAYFDAEKLKFPLLLRYWQKGDYFFPFGMIGKKVLSNLFSDLKLSLLEKENFLLLCNGTDIIWAVGQRTDQRYRVTKKTKKIFKIVLE